MNHFVKSHGGRNKVKKELMREFMPEKDITWVLGPKSTVMDKVERFLLENGGKVAYAWKGERRALPGESDCDVEGWDHAGTLVLVDALVQPAGRITTADQVPAQWARLRQHNAQET